MYTLKVHRYKSPTVSNHVTKYAEKRQTSYIYIKYVWLRCVCWGTDASKALAEMNQLEDKVKEAEEKVKRAASQPSSQIAPESGTYTGWIHLVYVCCEFNMFSSLKSHEVPPGVFLTWHISLRPLFSAPLFQSQKIVSPLISLILLPQLKDTDTQTQCRDCRPTIFKFVWFLSFPVVPMKPVYDIFTHI